MKCEELAFSKPASLFRDDVHLNVSNPDADGFAWTTVGETTRGAWTDLLVDLDIPSSWLTDLEVGDLVLRAWAMNDNADELVGEWDVLALSMNSVGARRYKRVRVSGQLAGAYRVELGTQSRTARTETATIVLDVWGSQGGTPGVWGETTSITARTHPPRTSLGFAMGDDGRWWPLTRDDDGLLRVTASVTPDPAARFVVHGDVTPTDLTDARSDCVPVWSFGSALDTDSGEWSFLQMSLGGLRVTGNHTLIDADADPSNVVQAEAFGMVWNETGSTWYKLRGDTEGYAYVHVTAYNAETPLITDAGHFLSVNNRGDVYTILGLPDPDATTPAQHQSVARSTTRTLVAKAAKGCLLGVTGNNAHATDGYYLCVVNKATAPVDGDPIVAAWWVPGNACVAPMFPRDLYLSAGVALCSSSTATTVTLFALTGSLEAFYC
jgi:hypothetical protein